MFVPSVNGRPGIPPEKPQPDANLTVVAAFITATATIIAAIISKQD
jgi:hypothetical protein